MMLVLRYLSHLCRTTPYLAYGAYLHHPSLSALGFQGFLKDLLLCTHDRVDPLLGLCLTWHRVELSKEESYSVERLYPRDKSTHSPCLEAQVLWARIARSFMFGRLDLLKLASCPFLRKLVLYFDGCSFNQTLALAIHIS